jgi:hypothetical protein
VTCWACIANALTSSVVPRISGVSTPNKRMDISSPNNGCMLGKYHALLGNVEESKNLVRRVFKLNGSFKADFLDDPAFDSVWESF